jgi:hypothetical protein
MLLTTSKSLPSYPKVNIKEKGVYRVKEGTMNHKSNGKYIVTTKRHKKNKPAFWEQGFLDTNENLGYKDTKGKPILGDGFVDYDKLTKLNDWDIKQKIAHWRKVFKHAQNRGIEITMFHWNVYLYGAKGLYGMEEDQSNQNAIDYMRYAVKEMILTYPEITSIGVAAGEHDNVSDTVRVSTEQYIYESYGKGVEDALKSNPKRKVNFVWRNHSTSLEDVKREFSDKYAGGHVEVSVKYTVGHMYSSRAPQEWQKRAVRAGWLDAGYNVWLNIRNDDTFMHRWGSPDYTRDFIANMPKESIGFMMGADGYIWGKEFIQKDRTSPLAGILEIDKHWYNFKLWGELAYNNTLDDQYWKAVLKHRFNLDDMNADKLFTAWESVSEIVPQLNRAVWAGTDAAFQAENCMSYNLSSGTGFLSIPKYYYGEPRRPYDREAMKLGRNPVKGEVQCMSIMEWYAKNMKNPIDKDTPFEVADKLDSYANIAEQHMNELENASTNIEYQELLIDIKSMAKLGCYYADKQRCAADYYAFRETQNDTYHSNAITHIKNAETHWTAYMELLDLHYIPQLTSRTSYLNWHKTFNGKTFGKFIQTVQQETQAIINKNTKFDKR